MFPMFDLSTQYAIRAMMHLASLEPGRLLQAHALARALGLPAPYLAKILQHLVREGLAVSRKGPSGGFALARPADRICVYDLLGCFQKLHRSDECILGHPQCSAEDPCALHEFWIQLRETVEATLRGMTLADLLRYERRRRELREDAAERLAASTGSTP